MFEFDKYDSNLHITPPVKADDRTDSPLNIEKMSFMVWSEHCIECAAPQCYTSCDLYSPRFDKRCRRFEYGLYKNKNFRTHRDSGAEMRFKKWGKLEAIGSTYMLPFSKALLLEKFFVALCSFINALGFMFSMISKNTRWKSLSHRLIEKFIYRLQNYSKNDELSNASFLLEIYNPNSVAVNLKLAFSINLARLPKNITPNQLPQPFLTLLNIPPGFFRKIIAADEVASIVNSNLVFNISLMPDGEENLHLVFLALDFVTFTHAKLTDIAMPMPSIISEQNENRADIKCIVFDLDNTLWEGILLEDKSISLRNGIKEQIEALDKKGILFSIASKNVHDHAWLKLQEFCLDKYFLYPKINWSPKSQNIKQIAKDLNIGLDTLLFIDDNPFELQEVGQSIPEVSCLHVDNISELSSNPRLKGNSSEDAKKRRILYRQEILRKDEQSTFGEDYITFLRSCNIVVNISDFSEDNFDRVAELVQRTNQLNFSGKKYNRLQIRDIINESRLEKWVITCKDKFGSYGTVGFCITSRQDNLLEIQDFMLSCRVQGKFIEQAIFAYLVNNQLNASVQRLKINFYPTEKNGPAQHVLQQLGFIQDSTGGMSKELNDNSFNCDFILVNN